jgi:hypothetical protein
LPELAIVLVVGGDFARLISASTGDEIDWEQHAAADHIAATSMMRTNVTSKPV